MRDHLKKAVILHSFHKKFKFELISVALINATDKGNISHIMDVATLLQHNKWNTDGLKKNEVSKTEEAAVKCLKCHLVYQTGKKWK